MNKPKLTNDQQKEIIERYLNGEMVADLKEEFGCSDTTIYWIYQGAEIFLQRKYDRYCKYYNINNSLIA